MPLTELEVRLHRRLAAAGCGARRCGSTEEVEHPPGPPAARPVDSVPSASGQRAALVHPATGYSVGSRSGPRPGGGGHRPGTRAPGDARGRLSWRAWAAVWPPDRRGRAGWRSSGSTALLRLDSLRTEPFFDSLLRARRRPVAGLPHRHARPAPWGRRAAARLSAADALRRLMPARRREPARPVVASRWPEAADRLAAPGGTQQDPRPGGGPRHPAGGAHDETTARRRPGAVPRRASGGGMSRGRGCGAAGSWASSSTYAGSSG